MMFSDGFDRLTAEEVAQRWPSPSPGSGQETPRQTTLTVTGHCPVCSERQTMTARVVASGKFSLVCPSCDAELAVLLSAGGAGRLRETGR